MIRQTVGRPCPIAFGDERSRQRHLRLVERAWRQQQHRWCVAPGSVLRSADGRELPAGTPVHPADFSETRRVGWIRTLSGPDKPDIRTTNGREVLDRLVWEGRGLFRSDIKEVEPEVEDHPLPPAA